MMLSFIIDSRDSVGNGIGCETCCCEVATMMPGETNKFQLDYSYWSIPIGGRGITASRTFSVEQMKAITPFSGSLPVVSTANPTTPLNTPLVGNLTTYATDVDLNPLTFGALPLFGPGSGTLALASSGAFTYTPNTGFTGYDRFFFSVSDGVNKPIVGEVVVGVAVSAAGAMMFTPKVKIRSDKAQVNQGLQTLSFPIEVSPAALVGEAYRMTVRQESNDCDFQSYWNMTCYDILISKCG